jgi:hypothetical protein
MTRGVKFHQEDDEPVRDVRERSQCFGEDVGKVLVVPGVKTSRRLGRKKSTRGMMSMMTFFVQYSSQVTQFLLFVLWAYGSAPFFPVHDLQVSLCRYLVWQSMTVDPKNLGMYLLVGDSQLSLGLRTSLG